MHNKIVFLIADTVSDFKAKLAVANGHVPNMQDATVLKPSQDVSKPLSVTPAEKPQKSQVKRLYYMYSRCFYSVFKLFLLTETAAES